MLQNNIDNKFSSQKGKAMIEQQYLLSIISSQQETLILNIETKYSACWCKHSCSVSNNFQANSEHFKMISN